MSVQHALRVTSIHFNSDNIVIFSGVPLPQQIYTHINPKFIITVKCKVLSLPVTPLKGQHWQVTGNFRSQLIEINGFKINEYVFENPELLICTLPESGEQFIHFIATEDDFIGVGDSKARKLWNMFGSDIYRILKEDTEQNKNLLREILTEKSIDSLFDGFKKYKNLIQCNFLSQLQIPSDIQQRLIKFHTEKTISIIKENPYTLVGFGMSFSNVDSIAKRFFCISDNDVKRLNSAVEAALQRWVQRGHTFATKAQLTPILIDLLKSPALVEKAFILGSKQYQYITNPITNDIHPTPQFVMENVVSQRLLKLAANHNTYDGFHSISNIDNALPYKLTPKQYQAVQNCLNNYVNAISGGAGTGKTTVIKTILHTYASLGFNIHAIALSGRAALKLQDSTGFKSLTIASFLHSPPLTISSSNENHILVIDEASMLDLPTMFRIINHISSNVRLIFVGDPNQLPPIGCGKILYDIIQSGKVVTTVLDIVKRQAHTTGIAEYAHLINNGLIPPALSSSKVFFHETQMYDIPQVCSYLYAEDITNSRVVAPTKKLTKDINLKIQSLVNPNGKRFEFTLQADRYFLDLRVGDTVLFTKNHYDKNVQNGSLGTLKALTNENELFGIIELDTKHRVEIDRKILDCLELGYCITLHKAQGSQFPRVIIALMPGKLVDRAWLYTAITRAEGEVHIVGSAADLFSIIAKQSASYIRNTYLSELLVGKTLIM